LEQAACLWLLLCLAAFFYQVSDSDKRFADQFEVAGPQIDCTRDSPKVRIARLPCGLFAFPLSYWALCMCVCSVIDYCVICAIISAASAAVVCIDALSLSLSLSLRDVNDVPTIAAIAGLDIEIALYMCAREPLHLCRAN